MTEIVVLDTNVLLISIPSKSKYRPIFNALLKGNFLLVITNEILSEYAEIIEQKTTVSIANHICEMLVALPNAMKVDVFYRWNLIAADRDDNKFVDAALAGGADVIVTNDKHFQELRKIGFPIVTTLLADDFLEKCRD
jgi:uncharacterized protein